MSEPACLDKLIVCLARLPGIGRRSAERMALKLARDPRGLLRELALALKEVGEQVGSCSRCGALSPVGTDPCRLCTDPRRDGTLLCVVEDPTDIRAIEKSLGFTGRYHALMGRLSPMDGEGPADLRIGELEKRIPAEGVREVILALNTDVESDATARFIADRLKSMNVKVTRIAFGLPAGSGIVYSDAVTLARAMKGRQDM